MRQGGITEMFSIYRVPVDANFDPPECGMEIGRYNNITDAIRNAERTMERENDPESAYFVVHSDVLRHIYSTGYMKEDA
jgi:hypothetical protein